VKQVAPEGLAAAALLSLMATAGLFYVNIMAALVSGLSDGLGIAASDAGLIASVNVYGAAFGGLLAIFAVRHIGWRSAAIVLLVALMVLDGVSVLFQNVTVVTAMRALHGIAGGLLVGFSFAVIARTAAPDRVFGMLLVVQFGLGGLGLWVLPPLVPIHGPWVLFAALFLFSLVTLLLLPLLPDFPEAKEAPESASGTFLSTPLLLTVIAIFLFQGGNMGLAAFIIELGRAAGISQDVIGPTLGFSSWIGMAGSALVVATGTRLGRLLPIIAGIAVTVVGTAAFHWSTNVAVYVACNLLTATLWAFVIPYLLGLAAAFDGSGRSAALGGFMSKMGLATGPLVASRLLDPANFDPMIFASALMLLLSGTVAFYPARLLDRRDREYSNRR